MVLMRIMMRKAAVRASCCTQHFYLAAPRRAAAPLVHENHALRSLASKALMHAELNPRMYSHLICTDRLVYKWAERLYDTINSILTGVLTMESVTLCPGQKAGTQPMDHHRYMSAYRLCNVHVAVIVVSFCVRFASLSVAGQRAMYDKPQADK
jgi:hypothetical protein